MGLGMESCGIHETTYNSIMKCDVDIGRTCTPTLSCPEAPPCTLVSLTGCRRRSPPSPPSSRCGSPSRSTMSLAPPSSTGSASKQLTSPSLNACCLQDRQNNQVAPSSHCDLRGHPMTWFQSNLCHLLFLVLA